MPPRKMSQKRLDSQFSDLIARNDDDNNSDDPTFLGSPPHIEGSSHRDSTNEDDHNEIVPQTLQETGSSSTNLARKGRGKNKNTAIGKLPVGQKMRLEFNDIDGKPYCDNRTYWSRHIGTIIRDPSVVSHRLLRWSDQSSNQLDHLWRCVTDPFEAVPNHIDTYRPKVMSHVKQIWDRWRCKINNDFIKIHGDDTRSVRANPPPEFNMNDWQHLLDNHYLSPDFRRRSATNSANRQHVTYLNHAGSRPFTQYERKEERETGRKPDFATMFLKTHSKKRSSVDPTPVATPEVQSKYDALVENQQQNPEMSQFDSIQNIFGSQGHGRVVGMGSGVRPTFFRGDHRASSSSSNSSQQSFREQNLALRAEMELMRKEQEEQHQQQMNLMREQMEEQQQQQLNLMREQMQDQLREQQEALQLQLAIIMSKFGDPPPSHDPPSQP